MKRISKNKIYELIGRAVTFTASWGLCVFAVYNLAIYILDKCITVYR